MYVYVCVSRTLCNRKCDEDKKSVRKIKKVSVSSIFFFFFEMINKKGQRAKVKTFDWRWGFLLLSVKWVILCASLCLYLAGRFLHLSLTHGPELARAAHLPPG